MTTRRGGIGRTGEGRLAWLLAMGSLVTFGVIGFNVQQDTDVVETVLNVSPMLTLLGVGPLLVSRVAGNPIGWWLTTAGVLFCATLAAHGVWTIGVVAEPEPWAVTGWAALLTKLLESIPIVIVIIFVPLHFPDGRLLSPRWHWVERLAVLAIGLGAVVTLLSPFTDGDAAVAGIANPTAIVGLEPLLGVLGALSTLRVVPVLLGAAASVVVRYRRAGDVQRQQLKWLLAVAAVAAIAFTTSIVPDDETLSTVLYMLGYLAVAALPVAIGIAILRYRLYEIDRIISRTVSWTLMTVALVAVFVSGVLVLQTAFAGITQAPTLSVAVSTLVAAALFQPLRMRVQRAVDRRFDRTAVDATRVADAFATRLRKEVDLETVTRDLVGTVDVVVRPESSSVWLRSVRAGT